MDAGHGCSTRISADDCFMRPLGHLVGIIRLLCIANHLQSNQPLKPLSRSIFVALFKSLPFKGGSRFEGVDLADVEPQKLRDKMASAIKTLVVAILCLSFWHANFEGQWTLVGYHDDGSLQPTRFEHAGGGSRG
jgi:hypothetical protein